MANLKIEPRSNGYAHGHRLYEAILRASFEILVEKGLDNLTFGNIARRIGKKPGNISYHFPSKDALISELINAIITNYENDINAILASTSTSDEDKFSLILDIIICDLPTKATTRVFTELWAKSNHDPFVQERLNDLYERGRAAFVDLISRINPQLTREQSHAVAVLVSAAHEGLTIFAGHGKPYEANIGEFSRIAQAILVKGIASLRPGDIWEIPAPPK